MGEKLDNSISFGFVNTESGETFEMTDASIEIESWCPNEQPEIRASGTYRGEIICDDIEINEDLYRTLVSPKDKCRFEMQYTIKVQARRHKKKRINKKWAKRYGHRPVVIKSEGWELDEYNTQTGEGVFLKR